MSNTMAAMPPCSLNSFPTGPSTSRKLGSFIAGAIVAPARPAFKRPLRPIRLPSAAEVLPPEDSAERDEGQQYPGIGEGPRAYEPHAERQAERGHQSARPQAEGRRLHLR